ncbi:vWA domain-containing protein [Ancylobacter lacus]|uniref:vWA domain-containing protein n=1 Tax=Ancylobacter lacus TaxID=2579970 RepID=UPI001BD0936B|nr:vWA domain-containing protein [Ancylobacter lacus]MBS7538860.1 VWA domain-containing protein [Ancylobacter lacus]
MSRRLSRRIGLDRRFGLLLAALAATCAALLAPRIERPRSARDLLLVVDITGSMNVRDYTVDGRPTSRLEVAKRALRDLLAALPCSSRVGLAVFTERRSFLLFEPAEVCGNFAPLDAELAALDWRMAWEGDSYIARGAQSGWELAQAVRADLVFLTDGHEAPPAPAAGLPPFERSGPPVHGLLVGVGGPEPAPIPKFDEDGRETGFYAEADVPQENRSGPPPADAESRPGYNPRNAPWGAEAASGTEHLSALREEHLRALAAQLGLGYARLESPDNLAGAVLAATEPRPVRALVETYPLPAALALLALVLAHLMPLGRRAARRSHPSSPPVTSQGNARP